MRFFCLAQKKNISLLSESGQRESCPGKKKLRLAWERAGIVAHHLDAAGWRVVEPVGTV